MEDELSIFAGHTRFVSAKKSAPKQRDTILKAHSAPSSQARHLAMDSSSAASYQTTFETARHPPQQGMLIPSVVSMEDRRHKEDFMPLLPIDDHQQSIRYPYVPSERTHQTELSPSYGWSSQPHHQPPPSELSLPPLRDYQHTSSTGGHGTVPRQFGHQQYGSQLQDPTLSLPPLESQPQAQPQRYSQSLPSNQRYDVVHQDQSHYHQGYVTPTPSTSTFNPELANLGLASRDSRLDERWSSFMQDSGLLEDNVNFRGN